MEFRRSVMIAVVVSLTVASIVFGVVATATAEWEYDVYFDTNAGLFKVCAPDAFNIKKCSSYPSESVPSYLKAVRAFIIIGDILLALALPLTILHAFGKLESGNKIIAATLAAAGLSFVIACSVYTGENRDISSYGIKYGYSFGLAWASGPIALVAALLAFFSSTGHYMPL